MLLSHHLHFFFCYNNYSTLLVPIVNRSETMFLSEDRQNYYVHIFIIYILINTHQKAMLQIFVRKLVLAHQRSKQWFSHVKKMIRPIRIVNDVFSRVRKMIHPIRSHRGVWVSHQNFSPFIAACSAASHTFKLWITELAWISSDYFESLLLPQ